MGQKSPTDSIIVLKSINFLLIGIGRKRHLASLAIDALGVYSEIGWVGRTLFLYMKFNHNLSKETLK